MQPPFPIIKKYDYPILEAVTKPTGRTYTTPCGDVVPSVTSLLNILPKPELEAWKERLGKEKADKVTAEACFIGSTMHDALEGYVSNYLQGRPNVPPATEKEREAYQLADNIKRYGLIDLDEVYGIEAALYCEDLYAGRTDLTCVYKGKSAILDYKSSKRWKEVKYLEAYKMQIAAYNFCHKSLFNQGMETGVILIALRPPYYGKDARRVQRVLMNKSEMNHYEDLWLKLVERYYAEKVNN